MFGARYLDTLNAEQRCAVEHGVAGRGANIAAPLLVIAGAGSGKTNTLAHRVAHLIVNGADPGRVLLLTFSRRAAAEMTRRVERIAAAALGETGRGGRNPIRWSGTFHAIGARILRMHAASVGLDPAFTIHDREDSADLMNLVRHELGYSEQARRFPLKATCLAIYSRAVNATEPLEAALKHFPWCAEWKDELTGLFAAYVEAKQAQGVLDYDDLLLYWGELMRVPELAVEVAALFDHVLVDEYQDTNALQAAILGGLKPDGAGLTVVGDDAQAIYGFRAATVRNILDFPGRFDPPATIVRLEQNYRSTQPILTASNAVIGLAREQFTKNLRSSRGAGERPALVSVADDIGQVGLIVEAVLANRECGMALKEQAVLFRTSHHSAMLEIELTRRNIPFVKFGGLKFTEAAHVKDMLAVLRWAENPTDRVTGFRVVQLLPGLGPATAAKVLDAMAGRSAIDALATFRPPAKAVDAWRDLVELMQSLSAQAGWPAELELVRQWYQPHLEQPLRGRRRALRRSRAARAHRCGLSLARSVPHRPHARSAGSVERGSRRAAARRGLPDPVDHPLRQGSGMEGGLCPQRRRRLHPLGHGHRQRRGDRGGTAAALRRHDARQGRAGAGGAAALLRAQPGKARRRPRLCRAHALHTGSHRTALRAAVLARADRIRFRRPAAHHDDSGPGRPHARHVADWDLRAGRGV